MEIYQPREDSFLISEQVELYLDKIDKREKLKVLDLGTGSGIISKTLLKKGVKKENVLAADLNDNAIKNMKKQGFKAIKSDLFKNIENSFDLIIFNPPYLPESKYDKEKDTTGGKRGDETILRFLKQVKKYLNKNGKIFLLMSSLTPKYRIEKEIEKQGIICKKITEKILFFETLEVYILS